MSAAPGSGRTVAVVIVSYNTRVALGRCLESLRHDRSGAVLQTWVVDNASRDGSAEMVRRQFPTVRLVARRDNVGFARAMNLALEQLEADAVLWLNPDAEVDPGTLAEMLSVLERHPRAGLVVPRLVNADGSLQRSLRRRTFYRPSHLFLAATGAARFLPAVHRLVERDRYGDWDHASEVEIDFANGACFLLPAAVVHAVGLLDERFVIYSEDMDYCERVRRAGYEVRYAPAARVVHLGGQSTRQAPTILRVHLVHSKWLFLGKHFGAFAAALYRASVVCEASVLVLGGVARRSLRWRARRAAAILRWAARPRPIPLPGSEGGGS